MNEDGRIYTGATFDALDTRDSYGYQVSQDLNDGRVAVTEIRAVNGPDDQPLFVVTHNGGSATLIPWHSVAIINSKE